MKVGTQGDALSRGSVRCPGRYGKRFLMPYTRLEASFLRRCNRLLSKRFSAHQIHKHFFSRQRTEIAMG